jgi:hypothetical protein
MAFKSAEYRPAQQTHVIHQFLKKPRRMRPRSAPPDEQSLSGRSPFFQEMILGGPDLPGERKGEDNSRSSHI